MGKGTQTSPDTSSRAFILADEPRHGCRQNARPPKSRMSANPTACAVNFCRSARTPPPAFLFLQTTLSKSPGDRRCEIPEPVMEPKAPPGVNAADNGLRGKSGARPASLLENDAASMQNRTQSGFARATVLYLQIPLREVKPHIRRNYDFSSHLRHGKPPAHQLHGFAGKMAASVTLLPECGGIFPR